MYTPGELVRLELLNYETPKGLHPVEIAWRDLARKLMEQNKQLQSALIHHHDSSYRPRLGDDCPVCTKQNIAFFKFPEPFKS